MTEIPVHALKQRDGTISSRNNYIAVFSKSKTLHFSLIFFSETSELF